MDYGYRMLRHVVAQVFGNFGQAARLTLLLTFLPITASAGKVPWLLGTEDWPVAVPSRARIEARDTSLCIVVTFGVAQRRHAGATDP